VAHILIERDLCKGCELCVHACPQKILGMGQEINAKGYGGGRAGAASAAGCAASPARTWRSR
jgi:2-oxoglutarate ferredoxin oxidoreductase subunit delta